MEYYHEKIETENGIPARIYYGGTGRDKLRYPLHWHHNLEFDLVLEGCIRGKIGGRPVEIHKGEIFFVNSGELHETDASEECCHASADEECDKQRKEQTNPPIMRAITVLLSDQLLREYCPNLDDWYFELRQGSLQQQRIAQLIQSCAVIQSEKKEFYELNLAIKLRQICMILLQECRVARNSMQNASAAKKTTKRIKKAISYMEEHYESVLSISDMAEVMGMTPTYFSRFFKQSTGQTFHSYLTLIRLNRAQEQLTESDLTVTELALNHGFPNVKSFIEAFREEYGMTPAKYRKQRETQK